MRGRKPKIIPTVRVSVRLPSDIAAKLALHLYSDLEGRVPHSAYQQFFSSLLTDYFSKLEQPL